MDISKQENIRILTLSYEGKFNSDTLAGFRRCLDEVEADEEASCLIITGEGKNFSQGLDIEHLGKAEQEASGGAVQFVHQCMHGLRQLLTLSIPSAAAVNGHAFGLGAMIAMSCDYSAMRRDRGYFCLPEIDLNMSLVPSMQSLVSEKLSPKVLRDTLFTGARLGAEEALAAGIVDTVVDEAEVMAAAIALTQPMLNKNRKVLKTIKTDTHQPIIDVIDQY